MQREIKFRIWYNHQARFDYGSFELFAEHSFPLNWCQIQQFTGLKDKNGQEIYEGDVVEYTVSVVNTETGVGEVKFDNGAFGVDYNPLFNIYEKNIKIIGNIFKNPELLKP